MFPRLRTTRGNRRRAALHLTAMAAVLGVAAGLTAYGTPQAHARLAPDSGLLVSTRDHYQMCLHTAPGLSDPGGARDALHASVSRVQKHPDWKAAFGAAAPTEGRDLPRCPTVRLPDRVDRTSVIGPGLSEEPSPYRTWVHVLDDRTADRVLGRGVPALTAPAELMRGEGHEVAAVSTAVLVREQHLDDPRFRTGPLTEAVGLGPRVD